MNSGRRTFLKFAGLTVVGVGISKPILTALAEGTTPRPAPKTGLTAKRWAMVINTRQCTAANGCQDCRIACHAAHNVPDIPNKKHEIKWIWNAPHEQVFPDNQNEFLDERLRQRPLPILCNHCDDPPCTRVCPTQATWRREDGVVMVDWHRCIGCRYCAVGCPYGARSFNFVDPRPHIKSQNPRFPTRMKGFVEKCNFCEERLAEGVPPACLVACKQKAITFGDLDDPSSPVRALLKQAYALQRKRHLGTNPKVYYLV